MTKVRLPVEVPLGRRVVELLQVDRFCQHGLRYMQVRFCLLGAQTSDLPSGRVVLAEVVDVVTVDSNSVQITATGIGQSLSSVVQDCRCARGKSASRAEVGVNVGDNGGVRVGKDWRQNNMLANSNWKKYG